MAILARSSSRTFLSWVGLLVFALSIPACGGPDVAEECISYVGCFDAFQESSDGAGDAAQIERFRDEGDCWNTQAAARDCRELCEASLPGLRGDFASLDDEAPAVCTLAE
ncbi:MAG: hypothetical protein GY822_09555 [Deltaproteobacteria bacterium]|nr:hypothetical protein [Deltaproteobacteria bacterium]